ncbi:uncharacterized protein [Eurosta solidaginis]|uniref:uncharacterized protein n=1 Tax=Eurosta solidaginis TaxID=178769 RepID=UPI00353176B5
MPDIKITKHMLHNLDYDCKYKLQSEKMTKATVCCKCLPAVLIVAEKGDINAAAYHLAQSMQNPFSSEVIVTVLVAESARAGFLQRLKPLLKTIPTEAAQNVERKNTLALIEKNNWETISVPELGSHSPVIVCDVTHEHLGTGYSGIVTLHTFRTILESISLCGKESLKPINASIWTSNNASAYEIALNIACQHIFIDCYGISLEPLQKLMSTVGAKESCVLIEQSYHYESLVLKFGGKNIVFPIGTSISN